MKKTTAIIIVLLSTLLTSIGQLFFKFGANKLSLENLFSNYLLFIGIILYIVALVIFILALKNNELSLLYPLYATSYIWVSLLSMFFLNETMNIFKEQKPNHRANSLWGILNNIHHSIKIRGINIALSFSIHNLYMDFNYIQ